MFVGLGVSTIVPTLYSIAGKPKCSTWRSFNDCVKCKFSWFSDGAPVIGYVAELSSLRFSFAFIGVFGILIAVMVSRIKAIQ
jgi:hypothetical protein